MTWDILIATVPNRAESLARIVAELERQIQEVAPNEIQVVSYCENFTMTLGRKRSIMIDDSKADYVCFVDDDDMVSEDYVSLIWEAMQSGPHVIGLQGRLFNDGVPEMPFYHSRKYRKWYQDKEAYYRNPNHLNPIQRRIAKRIGYLDITYGEDANYSVRLGRSGHVRTEVYIEKEIYFYYNNTKKKKTGL